ncbi:MAG: hypothetical protein KAU20_00770 [Nanoarchaeota archaeon]|nr:hypothetical protein [Nanoarchaeota archaeon]
MKKTIRNIFFSEKETIDNVFKTEIKTREDLEMYLRIGNLVYRYLLWDKPLHEEYKQDIQMENAGFY